MLNHLTTLWQNWRKTSRRKALIADLIIFNKKHDSLVSNHGIELLLLHLDKSNLKDVPFKVRRSFEVTVRTKNGYDLLQAITQLRRILETHYSVPEKFIPQQSKSMLLDDFLVDEDDTAVTVEDFYRKLRERTTGLLELMANTEHAHDSRGGYYWRKSQPLLEDITNVLRGLHDAVNS